MNAYLLKLFVCYILVLCFVVFLCTNERDNTYVQNYWCGVLEAGIGNVISKKIVGKSFKN